MPLELLALASRISADIASRNLVSTFTACCHSYCVDCNLLSRLPITSFRLFASFRASLFITSIESFCSRICSSKTLLVSTYSLLCRIRCFSIPSLYSDESSLARGSVSALVSPAAAPAVVAADSPSKTPKTKQYHGSVLLK